MSQLPFSTWMLVVNIWKSCNKFLKFPKFYFVLGCSICFWLQVMSLPWSVIRLTIAHDQSTVLTTILLGIISDLHNTTERASIFLKTELLYIEMSLRSIKVITLEFANFGSAAFSSSSPAVLESSSFSLSCLYSFTLRKKSTMILGWFPLSVLASKNKLYYTVRVHIQFPILRVLRGFHTTYSISFEHLPRLTT